jgi:hypothetical protein
MRLRRLISLALVALIAALAAAGCGSNDEGKPIPASIQRQLDARLDEAQRRLDNGSVGACEDITDKSEPDISQILERVPDDVDADVRDALNDGFSRLFELVSQRCEELQGQTDTEPKTTETTAPPDTTTDETTPTETDTTPTETTPEPTTPTTPTTPGNDNGNGNGNGDGGAGNGGVGNGGVQLPGGGGSTPPDNP